MLRVEKLTSLDGLLHPSLKVLADSFLPYLTSFNINYKVKWLAVIEFVLRADVPC